MLGHVRSLSSLSQAESQLADYFEWGKHRTWISNADDNIHALKSYDVKQKLWFRPAEIRQELICVVS